MGTERHEGHGAGAGGGALEGIRVLEIATMIVGPIAAQALGDMGADVIKVEAPEGDLMRRIGPRVSADMGSFFIGGNRNKRGLVLDLKTGFGKDAFDRLARNADVIVHSIRTDAATRLGLSYERLAGLNPAIIVCQVSGFSDAGPYAGRPAYDDVGQAVSGLAMLQSVVAGEPRYVPSIIADKVTGMNAAFAITTALCHRLRTGHGQAINVPMFESMVAFNMIEHLWGETFVPARGSTGYPPVSTAARRPFRTADGYLCVLPYTDAHWARFCAVVGDPELTADARYATHAARQADQTGFWNEVGRRVRQRATAAWIDALKAADVPYAEVNRMEDLLDDPHLDAIGFWRTYDHPTEGRLRLPGNPIALSATPASLRRPPPRLGEHTEEILREAGLPGTPPELAAPAAGHGENV